MPAWAAIHRPLSLERGATSATSPALGAADASPALAPEYLFGPMTQRC